MNHGREQDAVCRLDVQQKSGGGWNAALLVGEAWGMRDSGIGKAGWHVGYLCGALWTVAWPTGGWCRRWKERKTPPVGAR